MLPAKGSRLPAKGTHVMAEAEGVSAKGATGVRAKDTTEAVRCVAEVVVLASP